MRLTIGNQIILLLSEHADVEHKYLVPYERTQEGMAAALGISRNHIATELGRLMEAGYVVCEEKRKHVPNVTTKRKVYDLTDLGLVAAEEIDVMLMVLGGGAPEGNGGDGGPREIKAVRPRRPDA